MTLRGIYKRAVVSMPGGASGKTTEFLSFPFILFHTAQNTGLD
jgi:hypothetical protein